MHDLATLLRKKRVKRGMLELAMPETVLEYDADGMMSGAHFAKSDDSHRVIEEFMLAANEAVAAHFARLGVPFLGEVPLHATIRSGGDDGIPVISALPDSPQGKAFAALAASVIAAVDGTRTKCRSGDVIVRVDPRYFRPTEVQTLLGDPSKAKQKLGWAPRIPLRELVREMVEADHAAAQRDSLVKQAGFRAYDHHE